MMTRPRRCNSRSTRPWMVSTISLWSLLLLLLVETAVQGFLSPSTSLFQKNNAFSVQRHPSPSLCLEASALAAANTNSNDDEEGGDDDVWDLLSSKNLESMGPEKSQMQGFISEFLKKENFNKPDPKEAASTDNDNDKDNNSQKQRYTHLIAIPMGSCHELSIELESVQRAILYHCPVLVHACLVPATTRLPLLYVHQDGGASPLAVKHATESLHQIVQDVVQKCLYDKTDKSVPENNNNIIIRKEEDEDNNGNNKPSNMEGANADGIRPLTLTFQSLEVDGAKNNALHTVALSDDPGTVRLQRVVALLQTEIEQQLGWATSLPPDEHIENTNENDNDNLQPPVFRPRVPFMRLPSNFQKYLDPLPEDREGEELLRTSEEGGNGISPIFWATWWEDVFGTARLREIGIYPRTASVEGLAEDAFHVPSGEMVKLPEGNAALTQQETKFETYQEQRMKQAEYDVKLDHQLEKDGVDGSMVENSNDKDVDEFDPMLTKTRARLESIYQQDILEATQDDSDLQELVSPDNNDPERPIIDATLLDDWTQERIRKANAANGITTYEEAEVEEANNEDGKTAKSTSASTDTDVDVGNAKSEEELDEWTRERIRKAVDSMEAVKAREQLAIKKDKIDIQDNPVFQRFKDGTLVPESEKEKAIVEQEMEPFPSREQFVGFWNVMSSPTGFEPDDKDSSTSENLVLRVDGTTAGGPVLDPETNQKAAGGTWKITPNEDGDTAKLRIRLVIPPKKERILVMEGTAAKKALMSRKDLPPMASSTFGIPALEEKQKRARDNMDEELEDLTEEKITCTGKVWLEDAVTRKNKFDIGEFSIVKLNTPKDPSQYTITIPRPIRTQD